VSALVPACLALLLALAPARAQEIPEYRLKAAFLYNFAAFTEWPAEVGRTLNLCVHGPDPFGAELDTLGGRAVGQRRISVRRTAGLEALKDCQIVFVAGGAIDQLPRLTEALRGLPVLTVADSPDAARKGVVLNMKVVGGRVTFDANLGAARTARLVLSSKLLRLASEVVP
jgi:hypothetical protein